MAENKAVVGLDDIAWGYGEIEVPTYNGKTRRIQKVNFENVPFNESKTVGQALSELNNLLTSQHYQTVSDNIEKIRRVFFDLDAIQSVDLNKMNIDAVAGAIDEIRLVYLQLGALTEIQQMLPQYRQDKQNIEYLKCKIGRMIEDLRLTVQKANTLLYSKFEPMFNQLTAMEARLTELINNAVNTITQGNEMAVKLATYSLEIERKPNCWNPKVIVDDVNHRIVWQVPTVKGDCAVVEPNETLVRDSVNAYLATLPDLSSGLHVEDLADLGTFLGRFDTYAEFPTQDQLGNPVSVDDFVYLNIPDGTHKVGFYRYNGTAYEFLQTGGAEDETPSQDEIDAVINAKSVAFLFNNTIQSTDRKITLSEDKPGVGYVTTDGDTGRHYHWNVNDYPRPGLSANIESEHIVFDAITPLTIHAKFKTEPNANDDVYVVGDTTNGFVRMQSASGQNRWHFRLFIPGNAVKTYIVPFSDNFKPGIMLNVVTIWSSDGLDVFSNGEFITHIAVDYSDGYPHNINSIANVFAFTVAETQENGAEVDTYAYLFSLTNRRLTVDEALVLSK